MKSEVREFIDQAGLCRASVERLAEMLPEDDAELDNWIDEAVRESHNLAFMLLVFAALSRERVVHARHLVGGAKLIGAPAYLASIVFHVQGDMPEYLLKGIQNTAIYNETQATALLSIAIWCEKHRGGVYPDQLLPEAHALARRVGQVPEVEALLLSLALRAKDAGLQDLLRQHYPTLSEQKWKGVVEKSRVGALETVAGADVPILDLMPKTPTYPLDAGGTVRRAVPRIGRNEPCHCGSGKKYKNCCSEEDRTRLQNSSGVAGLTLKEVSASPERHLTLERLDRTAPAQLARMDPLEIPRSLLTEYFVRLSLFSVDRAAEFLEKLGYADDLEDSWIFAMWATVRTGRKDIGDRLMKLREPAGFTEDKLRLSHRLLLAQDDPAKCALLIDEAAKSVLQTEKSEELIDLAYSVGFSRFSALGILLYRGALALAPPAAAKTGYEQMLLLRGRLNLPPEDPIHEVLEAIRDKDDGEDTEAALREAEEKFEAKRREVRVLRESLDQLQKEVARRERPSSPDSPSSVPAGGESEQKLRDLRDKVQYLETTLKERHNERNALQRRLEKMQTRVEALRDNAQASTDSEQDREEDLLLPQDAEGYHPLRLIEFPRGFHERLNEFPHHVARAAMAALGRLAGGDSAAFGGAKRLKSAPNVIRQRIGIDFRLLFRLLPDRIQVIDLIPRQDLERKIKTLR